MSQPNSWKSWGWINKGLRNAYLLLLVWTFSHCCDHGYIREWEGCPACVLSEQGGTCQFKILSPVYNVKVWKLKMTCSLETGRFDYTISFNPSLWKCWWGSFPPSYKYTSTYPESWSNLAKARQLIDGRCGLLIPLFKTLKINVASHAMDSSCMLWGPHLSLFNYGRLGTQMWPHSLHTSIIRMWLAVFTVVW